MLKLTLLDEHHAGAHALELFRNEHGELTLTVYQLPGGAQFDFELDESDLEILSIMVERAKKRPPTPPGRK